MNCLKCGNPFRLCLCPVFEEFPKVQGPGYHLRPIKKGVVGESSKIREEMEELEDAEAQDCKIMQLVELADLVGAVRCYLARQFPNISFEQVVKMADITERAFLNGHR